jgi:hypothetical protein
VSKQFEATILYLKDDTRILVHPVEFSAQAQAWAADRTGRWGADVGTHTSAEVFEGQVYSTEVIYIETDFDAEKHGFAATELEAVHNWYVKNRLESNARIRRMS